MVVVDELFQAHPAGLRAPDTVPTLTTTGTGITGNCILYLTYAMELPNGKKICESNPSKASAAISLTNNSRVSGNIPASPPDTHATHVYGYVGVDGVVPRLCWKRQIGATTVTENVPTATLAAQDSISHEPETGAVKFDRGVFPYCKFIEIYHERSWLAGDPTNPNRLYYSKLGEFESMEGYIDTRDGEKITGIKRRGDQLVVFCLNCAYDIQGFSGADFVMRKLSPSVGCLSHHSIVNINERLWFLNERGVYIYDGSFRFIMQDLRTYWKDFYTSNQAVVQDCAAEDDRTHSVYKLLIPVSTGTRYFVADYQEFDPELGSGASQPRWSIDTRTRVDRAMGRVFDTSAKKTTFLCGSNDGYVRQENYSTNYNDDSDTAANALEIQTKHYLMDDPGGDAQEGKTLRRAWTYVQSSNTGFKVDFIGGDESVIDKSSGDWSDTIAATGNTTHCAKTVHIHVPEKVSGRGFSFQVTATSPNDLRFRGIGGIFGPGPAHRPVN